MVTETPPVEAVAVAAPTVTVTSSPTFASSPTFSPSPSFSSSASLSSLPLTSQ